MPTIHGVSASPFVRKVRVALAEKGIDYELNPVMPIGQNPEYLRKSPLGKIPCYEDGAFVLPDSSCIIAYLERTQPKPPLYPEDAQQFGRALFYEEYSDSKLTETLAPIFFQRFVQPRIFEKEPDEKLCLEKLEAAGPLFDYLEGELADREYLAGGRFSVADIAVGSIFVNFGYAGEKVDAKRWPRLAAYLARIHARPSFKALIEEERKSFGL
jgi:glutathione S-transferase